MKPQKTHSARAFATKAIHAGGHPDPETGAIMPPIYQTSTYVQSAPAEHKGFEYSRSHNPTRSRLEECLAALENARFALATSSGMSAATLVLHALPEGHTVLCGDDVYGGTYRILTTVFQHKFKVEFVDTTNLQLLEDKLKGSSPALVWLESPTNPLLKINDLRAISELVRRHGGQTLVDNTFASPYFQNPLDLGGDIVLHSMTKYLNGHSDVVGGCLMMNDESLHQRLWVLQNSLGPCQSPFDSWLVLRGVKTLALRMEAHQKNALALAEWLTEHPLVEKVLYPGLASHPQHQLAREQMRGHGGMLTFFLASKEAEHRRDAHKFLSRLRLFALAESLGGVESLVDHPGSMTHASIPPEVRASLGISDNLVRLSVGIEGVEDLKEDLGDALGAL